MCYTHMIITKIISLNWKPKYNFCALTLQFLSNFSHI